MTSASAGMSMLRVTTVSSASTTQSNTAAASRLKPTPTELTSPIRFLLNMVLPAMLHSLKDNAVLSNAMNTLNYTEATTEAAPSLIDISNNQGKENTGPAPRIAAKIAQDPAPTDQQSETNVSVCINITESNGQECSCCLKERLVGSCKESDNKNLCEETTDFHCSCRAPESEVVEEKEVHDQCECWDEHVESNNGELCFNNTIQHCSCQQTEAYTNGTNVTHQVSIEHGLTCNASFAEGQCGAFECHESHTLNLSLIHI
eukprot:TRINITY_DN1601_c0_g1_i3.p1 TRINITY_DN1601_c0_g1~~TRINITY_DN1601_c0_g1_i3.p1  ORF type:complete len:260 (+),score=49.07 TRINITY_DN1601_c0_g1_i3:417-1196(+)